MGAESSPLADSPEIKFSSAFLFEMTNTDTFTHSSLITPMQSQQVLE
jgi:hypothetical protein